MDLEEVILEKNLEIFLKLMQTHSLNILKSLNKENEYQFQKRIKLILIKRHREKIELKIPNLGEAESTEIIEVNIEPGKEVSLNDL